MVPQIDLLYLACNRLSYTIESVSALARNTDWSRVHRIVVYDDGSVDGTREFIRAWSPKAPVPAELRYTKFGSPVAVMKDFLERGGAEIFAKVDNDAMLPPGWLGAALEAMHRPDGPDLLGIEPQPWQGEDLSGEDYNYAPAEAIGGIGLMRRSIFDGTMVPVAVHGGFDAWQQRHPEVRKGWLVPPIRMFLLDRVPIEPWQSLSEAYVRLGWQRPWPTYSTKNEWQWRWWRGCPHATA